MMEKRGKTASDGAEMLKFSYRNKKVTEIFGGL
jgi:hypothetical protein